jgi:hypothetical protein
VSTTASPGGIAWKGASRIVRWALASMLPQLAAGGCTPSPRKLSPASIVMAAANTNVACTAIGPVMLGATWWRSRRQRPAPVTRAPST